MNKPFFYFVSCIILLIFTEASFADDFVLYQIQSKDKAHEQVLLKTSPNKEKFVANLNLSNMKCVPSSGLLIDDSFYIFEKVSTREDNLVRVNIFSGKKDSIFTFPNQSIGENYKAGTIIYIDESRIFFKAHTATFGNPIYNFNVFIFNKQLKMTTKIPLTVSGGVSTNDGNRLYFVTGEDQISVYEDGKIEYLGIEGHNPTISPNGEYIAYISTGKLFEKIKVYNIKNKISKTIHSFIGPRVVSHIMRWSSDSNLLAFHKQSDISLKPLYVVDISNGQIVHKFKKNWSTNWFFTK